jgi:hypothetical protein
MSGSEYFELPAEQKKIVCACAEMLRSGDYPLTSQVISEFNRVHTASIHVDKNWLKQVTTERRQCVFEQQQADVRKKEEEKKAVLEEIREQLVSKGIYMWKCYHLDKQSHKEIQDDLIALEQDNKGVIRISCYPGERGQRYQLFEIKLISI